ncbi:MAG: (2Fe-2S) ferredoxin domain-containing protein [Kiritimatiellia bacterium]
MAAMTLEELRALRASKQKELSQRDAGQGATEIIVGMGTCGIAAGAKETFSAIIDELAKQDISNVVVKQTGCMGLCASEPSVEVIKPGMPGIVYGKVDDAIARKIVQKHILKDQFVGEYIFDKPAADIMK